MKKFFNFLTDLILYFFIGSGVTFGFFILVYIITVFMHWASIAPYDALATIWLVGCITFVGYMSTIFINRYLIGKKSNDDDN